jgi:methyltransferase (TIGR00027 family)
MPIPNLSNSLSVARLRHIQSIHEPAPWRGPDTLVRYFLPLRERILTAWISESKLSRLRAEPFYHYLIARTKYYDQMLIEAVCGGVERILIVGCGSDTRAYRFKNLLGNGRVKVLECDQAELIHERQRIVKRWRDVLYVEHLAVDLNDGHWPELEQWLGNSSGAKTLVLMEGVSPYIDSESFIRFLQLLGVKLAAGSQLVYDYKVTGAEDRFVRTGRPAQAFRLSADRSEAARFHERWGLHLEDLELSSVLHQSLFPSESSHALFEGDVLARLSVKLASTC